MARNFGLPPEYSLVPPEYSLVPPESSLVPPEYSLVPPEYSLVHDSSIDLTAPEKVVLEHEDTASIIPVEITFDDRMNRVGFIQKVLGITFMQVLAVILVMACFLTFPSYDLIMDHNHISLHNTLEDSSSTHSPPFARSLLVVVSAGAYLVTLGLLISCDDARRKKPYKYIFLVIYPLTFAIFISLLTYLEMLIVMISAWIFFLVVLFALLLYSIAAIGTKLDFTIKNAIYLSGSIISLMYVFSLPYVYTEPVYASCLVVVSLWVFVQCAYILKDIEAMMAKEYRFAITPADFVMGALVIHIDYRYILTKTFYSI